MAKIKAESLLSLDIAGTDSPLHNGERKDVDSARREE